MPRSSDSPPPPRSLDFSSFFQSSTSEEEAGLKLMVEQAPIDGCFFLLLTYDGRVLTYAAILMGDDADRGVFDAVKKAKTLNDYIEIMAGIKSPHPSKIPMLNSLRHYAANRQITYDQLNHFFLQQYSQYYRAVPSRGLTDHRP